MKPIPTITALMAKVATLSRGDPMKRIWIRRTMKVIGATDWTVSLRASLK
ncbi:hypothetical protein [Candidatus Methanocrinis natronophilus]|uniref:Uncharacterized protein n=1 Tax=Candidatus Methanocrinis natronophilus TaxID=3033396 RepID=A0ABT5X6Y3_9EURY|nr:hypothetical protein [Candidatus Methanocrinis natronophilus]MDF0590464.1 hypothetical protein [Candidatus Methanocrinis natronophilus]